MHTVWKGALSFGLVNVPVSLVQTTQKTRVSFRQLHAEGHPPAPIKQEKKCSRCGETVKKDALVRGVAVAKDSFVVITDEELEKAEPESSRALQIKEFVSASAIDPIYRVSSYAVAPQPGGERAYALLHDALSRRNEIAVGRLAMRNHEYVVGLRAGDRLLFVDVLHYADEVKDLGEIETKVAQESEITKEEAELADVLIERLHRDWDPAKYEDRYGEAVKELVAAKARGEVYHAPTPESKPSTTDLLSALRETLKMEEEKRGAEREAEAA